MVEGTQAAGGKTYCYIYVIENNNCKWYVTEIFARGRNGIDCVFKTVYPRAD